MKKLIKLLQTISLLLLLVACSNKSNVEDDNGSEDTAVSAASPEEMTSDLSIPSAGIDFPMGTNDTEKEKITQKFILSKTEVTYDLWYKVRIWAEKNKGYSFANLGREGHDGNLSEKNYSPTSAKNEPVTKISWRDAIVWCNAYTEWYNTTKSPTIPLTVVYYSDPNYDTPLRTSTNNSSVSTTAGSEDKPYIKANATNNTDMAKNIATGFRLPTSAEWEFAARLRTDATNVVTTLPAGVSSPLSLNGKQYWFTKGNSASGAKADYSNATETEKVARYETNSCNIGSGCSINGSDGKGSKTQNVATLTANSLGLYDMSGNVREWCFDKEGFGRVVRGGSWGDRVSDPTGDNSIKKLQIGFVDSFDVKDTNIGVGFRVVRSLP